MFPASHTRLLCRAVLACLVWLGGCAAAPMTSPLDGGRAWRELRSKHCTLVTDAESEKAVELVTALEATHAALQAIAFPYVVKLEGTTNVVHFQGADDLGALGYEEAGGIAPALWNGFDLDRVLILRDIEKEAGRELAQHELVHRFVHFYYPNAPTWLDEGLAEYYSTLRFVPGEAVLIGEYTSAVTFSRHTGVAIFARERLVLPVATMPSV